MRRTDLARRLAEDLRRLGVREGGVLLVHASLRALGPAGRDAETIVRGLLAAVGPAGALLMPGLSYAWVTPRQPVFDVRRTPANVGALAEYFRTRPGTLRSLHPTHSVCGVGPPAATLLARHSEDRTPCGPCSPFRLLAQHGGQILMLGCGLRPNTSMHGIEELSEPPYLYGGVQTYRLIGWDGTTWEATYRVHGFEGWVQRYDRIGDVLASPALRQGSVLDARAHLIEAAALWAAADARLRRDPLFFVERAAGA